MSTQIRNSGGGGGGRNKNKSNHTGGGGGDANPASQSTTNSKKTDATKTEKEKVHPKPTAEQLRIAQITNSNASEDPQMREKVATLIEMTQRSEEEVCCALNECDNNLERAVVFLLETLPVGAFETSSKKKKNKAANAAQEVSGTDGEWANDSNANTDKREKSRNRASNRGGRGGTDSRGWRGREARENERNLRESRGGAGGGGGGGGGGDREDRNNDNYRGPRRDGRSAGRGGGYAGRGGRGGGRMGGGRGPRGDRGYGSRHNTNEEHQEVELWDNTIAQNAEKQQQQQQQDDAWGDWDNEEYVGSLKDSKVFTTSNLNNQTAASVLSGNGGGAGVVINNTNEISAPPGLEHHLGTSVLGGTASASQQGSHLNALVGNTTGNGSLLGESADGNTSATAGVQTGSVVGQSSTSMMQYSAAVSSNQLPQQSQQQSSSSAGVVSGATQTQSFSSTGVDTFSNAATAAANLVQQVQQQQQQAQLKSSATLSAEQSQYFNSLASQSGGAPGTVQQQQQQPMATYAQSAAAVNYPQTFANVFGTGATTDQTQQQPQVRRARAKLPPPSKIPASAVEMPGDSLNTVGYLDVQFGGLDFGADESFDGLSEKFTAAVNIDGQQQVQQEEVTNDYQNKASVQQQGNLSSGLQNAQITDSLTSASYTQRGAPQQQQTQVVSATSAASTLDQLKSDPYNQTNSASATSYQNPYQASTAAKSAANAYQHVATGSGQGYNSASYANVQSSVTASSYQPQGYSVYQQNSVNSYQQQHQQQQQTSSQSIATNAVAAGNNGSVVAQSGGVSGSTTQNIPVGNNSSANANSSTGYLSSGYSTQPSAYQSSQSVYGSTGLSNNTGYAGSSSTSTSQYSNFSTSAKLKETSTSSSTTHYDSVSSSNSGGSNSSTSVNSTNANVNSAGVVTNNNSSSAGVSNSVNNNNGTSNATVSSVVAGSQANNGSAVSGTVVAASGVSASSNKNSNTGSGSSSGAISGSSGGGASGAGAGGMVPTNIQMVSQYIQTGLPYYQQPVYSYEDLQMMQQRVQHVPGYYDLNYTPTSLNTGRDSLGSVAYSTMTDGRFARTDNNSSPVSNVSSTMSQQAGSSAPMLNVPYAAYFYGGNVMPGSFQYGTPAIYPQQIPAANTPSGGQFPKPSYNTGYNSTSYDTLSQASQDYTKGAYQSSVNQQTKSQNVTNQAQAGTGSDITSTMYGKGHVALNKVNSYEKQNFHSGTPPPFNMANTQTAGGTSAQPYGMYLQMPAAGHHSMIHQPMHQMDGRIHSSSRRDSNSTGQRQQTSSQSKSANKQGYTPSYWTGQN